MKLILTEQQAKNLVNKVNPPDTSGDEDLTKLMNFFASSKQSDDTGIDKADTSNLSPTVSNTSGELQSAPTIPPGQEPMHPLGHKEPITSGFGYRNLAYGSKFHKGIDLSTPSGSPVYAPLDGMVVDSRDTTPNGCGGYIYLDHDSMETKYCHLKELVAKKGQQVKKGQVIAYSGGGLNDPMRGDASGLIYIMKF